jgi:hypothetical protein
MVKYILAIMGNNQMLCWPWGSPKIHPALAKVGGIDHSRHASELKLFIYLHRGTIAQWPAAQFFGFAETLD